MKKKLMMFFISLFLGFVLFGCNLFTIDNTSPIEKTSEQTTDDENEKTFYTISEVKSSPIGHEYTTQGVVVGISNDGFLIYDESDFIYIYLGLKPDVKISDLITVIGTSNIYEDEIQIENVSNIIKIKTVEGYDFEVIELNNENIEEYLDNYQVGDYIKLTGILTKDEDMFKLNSAILKSEVNEDLLDKNVSVEGFVLYKTNDAINLIVSDIKKTLDFFPLTILTINDLHGHIEQDKDGKIGISNMAYLIDKIRNENDLDDVILIGNGDLFQGTFLSNRSFGRVVIECMNVMNFDAIGIGNHEFDWGIEKILQYFDGIEENGEANFPLLNANIYLKEDDSLLTIENGNVLNAHVVKKEGVQVGIISYIGDVYSSIAYDKVKDYYFDLNIARSVENIALDLKNDGVDVIIVNIHGGSYYINQYQYNLQLANLKDEKGNYLVDAVINGHTHSLTMGHISRSDGVDMPVIQSGSNGYNVGRITLNMDLREMKIIDFESENISVYTVGANYDVEVQKIVNDYRERYPDEFLIVAGETINYKSDYYDWIGNVMLAATDADIAIHNTGGVRSTGNIVANQDVMLSQLYEISPFDNNLFILEVKYRDIKYILQNTSLFYSVKEGISLRDNNTYKVVVISYVYYYEQFDDIRSDNDIETDLYIRDILVADLLAKNGKGEVFRPKTNPKATIGKLF